DALQRRAAARFHRQEDRPLVREQGRCFSFFGLRRSSPLCLWLLFFFSEEVTAERCGLAALKRKTKAKGKAATIAAIQRKKNTSVDSALGLAHDLEDLHRRG